MKRAYYTVLKRKGRWGICAFGEPFFECETYQEALEVSVTAASILAHSHRLYVSEDHPECSETRGSNGSSLLTGQDQIAGAQMKTTTFVRINNVHNFADQLTSAADPAKRATLIRLLVEEEDKLGVGLAQLGAAELRLATGARLIARQKELIARMQTDGRDTKHANNLLDTMTEVQALFEKYRRRIVARLDDVAI